MKFYPDTAVWELTNICNANCIHCGSKSGHARPGELTEVEALQLCDDLKELGCKRITLMGGEFFLSPYWEKVAKRLVDYGIRVAPLTNGLLVTPENRAQLKACRITNISFSFDGLAKTHDYIRGVPGIFNRAVEHMRQAKAEGFLIGVNTTVTALNLAELPKLHDFLVAEGVPLWQIQIVEDMGNVNEHQQLQLGIEQYYELAKCMVEMRQKKQIQVLTCHNIGWFTSFEPLLRDEPFTGCIAGRYAVGIESNGNVRGCLSIMGGNPEANVEGNIKERSLVEIWRDPESFKPFRHREVADLTGFCAACEYNNLCRGGCSSLAYSLIERFTENPYCLHKYEVERGIEWAVGE